MVNFKIMRSCSFGKTEEQRETQSELTTIRPRYDPKTSMLWHLIKHGGNFT